MSLMFKPHRREPTEPQLAAMIDVFSILIIFLIAGTVMGNTSVILPEGLTPPISASHETMTTVPQITVLADRVETSFSTSSYALRAFLAETSDDPDLVRFKSDVAALVAAGKNKGDVGVLNFVADKSLPYERLFKVIKAAREAGAESILFVALSEGKRE